MIQGPASRTLIRKSELALFERLKTPLWIFNLESKRVAWANNTALALWNAASVEELRARSFDDALSAPMQTRLLGYSQALQRGDNIEERWTFYPSGDPITVWCSCSPIELEEQSGLMVLVEGAPERKTSSNETSKQRLQALYARSTQERNFIAAVLDTIGSLVVVTDGTGKIARVNRAVEDLVGKSQAQLRGTFLWDAWLTPEESTRAKKLYASLSEGPTADLLEDYEGYLIDALGRRRRIAWTTTCLRDPQGGIAHVVGAGVDVTEKRDLHMKLQLSDRMASVGTLAAGVAHEINNPLLYMLTNLDLLGRQIKGGALDSLAQEVAEEFRVCIAECHDGAERIRQVVRELNEFTRPTAGEMAPVDICQVIDRACSLAGNQIRHKAQLVFDYHPVPKVRGSMAKLGQVMINLLVNAAQAMPDGQADRHTITLRTRLEGDNVIVEVQDTGPGIPPAKLARIFDPFFTTKAVGEGMGLGLSICHRIMNEHGGHISAHSQGPGSGATFRLEIPIAHDNAVPSTQKIPATPKMRILLVDDEPRICQSLCRMLSEHDVVVAKSGREALALFSDKGPFDVILCDLMMPEGTGMDLYSSLKNKHPGSEERVVFITGGTFTRRAREFLDQVSNPRLFKPFGKDDVTRAVRLLSAGG